MSTNEAMRSASVANLDMKLEVVVIPVSNVDRAKEFYSRLGWRLDADRAAGNDFRLVQFTPPGSGSSVQFGINLTSATPGSAQGLLLIVSDIEAARQQLVTQGVVPAVCDFPHGIEQIFEFFVVEPRKPPQRADCNLVALRVDSERGVGCGQE